MIDSANKYTRTYMWITLCNCLCFLYFMGIYRDVGNAILILFVLSIISFFAAMIHVNESYAINKKNYLAFIF